MLVTDTQKPMEKIGSDPLVSLDDLRDPKRRPGE